MSLVDQMSRRTRIEDSPVVMEFGGMGRMGGNLRLMESSKIPWDREKSRDGGSKDVIVVLVP